MLSNDLSQNNDFTNVLLCCCSCSCLWSSCGRGGQALPINKVTVVADLNWGDHTNIMFYQSRDREEGVGEDEDENGHQRHHSAIITIIILIIKEGTLTWHEGTPAWQSSQLVEMSSQEERRKQTNLKSYHCHRHHKASQRIISC